MKSIDFKGMCMKGMTNYTLVTVIAMIAMMLLLVVIATVFGGTIGSAERAVESCPESLSGASDRLEWDLC